MSRRGNCIDNAMIEGFFGTMKKEMFFGKEHEFESIEQLIECIDNYVDKYNNMRI